MGRNPVGGEPPRHLLNGELVFGERELASHRIKPAPR
jgi:hypothetical protein